MITYKVYKITNKVNGKVYIGITQQQYISHRFWEHKNRKRSAGAYLHWSINKYGDENFLIETLHQCTTIQEAKNTEVELIAKLKLNRYKYPNGNGMNLTDGGDGSYGCKHKTSSIKKMSGKNNHNYGLFGSKNPTSRAIKQYSLEGKYLQTFGSLHEVARWLKPGCSKNQQNSMASNIGSSIAGRRGMTQAYNFTWQYA
jgi:group I intron endonuclease